MTLSAPILTVTQLNRQIRSWLESDIGMINVEGEISTLSKPASGHYYFTLKDATAQIRCVFFKNRHTTPDTIQQGQLVVIRGTLSLYEARGDYQLIVDDIKEAGLGNLFRQFELLKAKLSALGLFDAARKKPLPKFPTTIGVITSPTGAAVHDILTTLARRFPFAHVIVYGCEVQGRQASEQLIQAIQKANIDKRADVLILARGGGSIEDLWAFNEEQLAYAISNSIVPIISGVGHETDFTIADFVSDCRAATPTTAAEAASPNMLELLALLQTIEARLFTLINRQLQHNHLLVHHETQKLSSPKRLINSYWQSLDYLLQHLQRNMAQSINYKRHLIRLLESNLQAKNPAALLQQEKIRLQHVEQRLVQHITSCIQILKQQFLAQLSTLHAVSPLATLERGYAITTYGPTVLMNSEQVHIGDLIETRLAKGKLRSKVIEIMQ